MKAVKIETAEMMQRVQAAMEADGGHNVPCVSHALIGSDGEVWGAFSSVYAPCLFFWMDSTKGNGLASLRGMRAARGVFLSLGHKRILLPIEPSSPYYAWVESVGFTRIGSCELFQLTPSEE